jgi:hypothetical protein
VAYVFGFFVMLAMLGWHPDAPHKKRVELPAAFPMLVGLQQRQGGDDACA